MNVLQIVPELDAGGVERTAIEVAAALHQRGHSPHLACAGGRLENEFFAAGGKLHRLPMASKNPFVWRRNARALRQIIKDEKIDIVHARSRAPAFAAQWAAEKSGVNFVTTYHGIYNGARWPKTYYNAVMTRGQPIIANSEYTKAHIVKTHGIDPAQISVVPRGVDMRYFNPKAVTAADIAPFKSAWGGGSEPVILLPGRLTRWKGQLLAIKAMKILKARSTEARLVLMGDAQGRAHYVAELTKAINEAGLAPNVMIANHSTDIRAAIAACDIVLSASIEPEAFGRVAAEGQAMEKIVIASDHGGARETIIDGQTGYRVPPGDDRALARSIESALALPEKRRRALQQAARRHIENNYSAARMVDSVLDIYENVISGVYTA